MLQWACNLHQATMVWRSVLQAAVPSSAVSPALFRKRQKRGDVESAIPTTPSFPVFKEPSELPITSRYCQYITLEKVGVSSETHNFLFSKIFLQTLQTVCFCSHQGIAEIPNCAISSPSPYSWENDGQGIPIKLLLCLGNQALSVQAYL